ncbi:hypothetical protein J40TS1_27620 [Paenibacillus montaniterrae]|uniref:ABC3 transporter permease C-terminal domain-containing protein n=1 Tax=Paenibacillus montaniterrae TaxID=429341 RepID=A0A920CY84_9BACL|nr:FtsX-like permease family protein [Paenibacillus montaniterrae]GIP17120.1 hypothetical protein J40TS1_27620 [Paenibacillus montaniterrae]
MITTIKDVAFKLFKSNKYMVLSSILCIALAVSLIVTMFGVAAQTDEATKRDLLALNGFIIVLSILVVIVVSMVIIANFEMYIYRNNHQFAVMRALGASSEQLFYIVWRQSAILNVTGGTVGFIVSWLSFHFFQPYLATLLGSDLATSSFHHLQAIVITLLCMLAIQLFMVAPAYRCSNVLPLKFMQHNERLNFSFGKGRKIAGRILVALSLLLAFIGGYINPAAGTVLAAALFLITGLYMLFPIYFTSLLTRLLPKLKHLFGTVPYLSVKHMLPQVKRNTFIMLITSTLMIITVFGTTLLHSVNLNGERYIRSQFVTDIILTSKLGWDTKLDQAELTERIDSTLGEQTAVAVSTLSHMEMMTETGSYSFDAAFVQLNRLENLDLLPADTAYSSDGVVLSEHAAERLGVSRGEQLLLGVFSEEYQQTIPVMEVTVQGIVEQMPTYGDAYLDWSIMKMTQPDAKFSKAFIQAKPDEAALYKLETLKSYYPELVISTLQEELVRNKDMFLQRWTIFIVILVAMLLSIMLAVYQTLFNNIRAKRKEIAVLRAISLKKRGVVGFIVTQVTTYLISGIIFGIILGVLLTFVLSLIDPETTLHFHYTFIYTIPVLLLVGAYIIFIPFAARLGSKKLLLELNHDNK